MMLQVRSRCVRWVLLLHVVWLTNTVCGISQAGTAGEKARLIVITDIGNEPDDQMSLVRLLLYSNEIDIEGLIAATSTWQRAKTHPETIHSLIQAYATVRPNLLLNAPGWPDAAALDRVVTTGQPAYGLAATGPGRESDGADLIVKALAEPDPRPLWIALWGGPNTLYQALLHLRATRQPAEVERLVRKLRISSISDQDDTGPMIRREFPALFYVVSPSTPTSGEYRYATWTGISGDLYYRNGEGADTSLVTNEWLEEHIRRGKLGNLYPRFMFIMEGDTPSFLNLIRNGLASETRPDFGGWGGRYVYRQPYGESRAVWTQGGDEFERVTSEDTVVGVDGRPHVSDQATIWRWRAAYQNDFAARIAWTLGDSAHANHAPIAVVNGVGGTNPIVVEATVGQAVTLDASLSRDPDKDPIQFRWFHYAEAGGSASETEKPASLAALALTGTDTARLTVTATATCREAWLPGYLKCPEVGVAHLILAVTDEGTPQMTSYRRVILNVREATKVLPRK